MGALPRPDIPPGAQRELADALHDLHHRAGWPSLRRLAAEAGCSHTTVSKAFSHPTLPSWGTLELLVEAMGGDVPAFHELWLAASTPTTDTPTAPPVRIAGRRAELTAVRRHLETGRGLLLVTGEAGIGKTTLVQAAAARVDCFVAVGHCLPLSTEVPLLPVIDVLRAVHEVDGGQWLKEALADCPAFVRLALSPVLPELASDPVAAELGELARQHIFTAVGRCLTKLRELKPLAAVLEDLHWADSATLDLIEHLVAGGPGIPLIGTWRTEDVAIDERHVAWLDRVGRSVDASCDLAALSLNETIEQLGLHTGGSVDDAMAAHIHDRSRGHPLFTEHLAIESQDATDLPRHLADALDRRLDGLTDDPATVVTALGVADRGLDHQLLAAVAGLDHARLVGALHALSTRHLLAAGTESSVELRHPLLAEAARRRLVPGEAAAMHRRLATVLAEQAAANAAEVAEHWRNAGDAREELRWRLEAAQQAHDRTAPGAEARQWLRALEIHDDLPGSDLDAVRARVAAFDAFELSGELDAALAVARPAMETVDNLDDLLAAEVLRRVSMAEDWLHDDTNLGLALIDRALDRLAHHGPTEALVHALDVRANHLMDLGLFDDALLALRRALNACEELGDVGLYFGTSATLAWHQAHLGDLDESLRTIGRARGRVPGSAGPRREAYLAMMHTDALIQHRRPAEEVMAAAAPALEIGREWDMDFHLLTVARANVVEALFKTGRVREAAEALALLPMSNKYDHWPVTWMSGLIAIVEGRPAEGLTTFRGLEVTGTTSSNILNRARWIAVAELWLLRPQSAWDVVVPAIEGVVDQWMVTDFGQAFVTAARAAADVAVRAPSRAETLRNQLVELRARAIVDPLGPGPAPIIRRAATAQWEAELGRLDHRDTAEQWSAAAREWDVLRSPHDAAYCRWRAAQAALREGQGTLADRLLRRAARDAREHVPLSQAIAATLPRTR